MPNDDGMGSGPMTGRKFKDLDGLFKLYFNYAMGAARSGWMPRHVMWVDPTAGPARYPLEDGTDTLGTPIRAMRDLIECSARLGVPFHALFYEWDADRFAQLTANLETEFGSTSLNPNGYQLSNSDARADLEQFKTDLPPGLGGFIYDPTGVPDFDFLANLSAAPRLRRYDLLVYLSATALKRTRLVPNATDTRTLIERLATVRKKRTIVRAPIPGDPWQWTWLILTNDPKFPAWKKNHFHAADTSDGQRSLDIFNLSDGERRQRDLRNGLFGEDQ